MSTSVTPMVTRGHYRKYWVIKDEHDQELPDWIGARTAQIVGLYSTKQ